VLVEVDEGDVERLQPVPQEWFGLFVVPDLDGQPAAPKCRIIRTVT
jgi:hypothetical protein